MITRGTTPTIVFAVNDFDLENADTIHVYFSQNNKLLLKKVTPDVEIDERNSSVRIPLTQEDTFALKVGEISIRFRLKTTGGTVFASTEIVEEVEDIADDDEVL